MPSIREAEARTAELRRDIARRVRLAVRQREAELRHEFRCELDALRLGHAGVPAVVWWWRLVSPWVCAVLLMYSVRQTYDWPLLHWMEWPWW